MNFLVALLCILLAAALCKMGYDWWIRKRDQEEREKLESDREAALAAIAILNDKLDKQTKEANDVLALNVGGRSIADIAADYNSPD